MSSREALGGFFEKKGPKKKKSNRQAAEETSPAAISSADRPAEKGSSFAVDAVADQRPASIERTPGATDRSAEAAEETAPAAISSADPSAENGSSLAVDAVADQRPASIEGTPGATDRPAEVANSADDAGLCAVGGESPCASGLLPFEGGDGCCENLCMTSVDSAPVIETMSDGKEPGKERKSWRTALLGKPVASSTSLDPGPRLEFAASSRERVEIRGIDPTTLEPEFVAQFPPVVGGVDGVAWSSDGRWLGLMGSRALRVVSASAPDAYETVHELPTLGGDEGQGLRGFQFSPMGTFVACYESPTFGDAQGETNSNLGIWRLSDSDGSPPCLWSALECCVWPALKFTDDEQWCCFLAQKELQVFDGAAGLQQGRPSAVIPCDNVLTFEVSRHRDSANKAASVAMFIPRRRDGDESARCLVYRLDDVQEPIVTHEVPMAEKAVLRWNFEGTALLMLASTEVDDSNKSYYGSTALHFLRTDGSRTEVVGARGGPLHDVAWCPTRDEFLVLQGDLPCSVSLFDGRDAKMKLDFGKAYRNTVKWSPFGRFFCLGGFGQLAGELDFWDASTQSRIGQNRYECCVDCNWSADGRSLLGWTTAPRMRVENRLELFDYLGNRLLRLDFDELYATSLRPSPVGTFTDRPATPERTRSNTEGGETKRVAAYRAPMSSGALAARLRAEEVGGARTTARTAKEQAAEAAERKGPGKGIPPTPKEFRDVPVPFSMVRMLMGPGRSNMLALTDEVGLKIRVLAQSDSRETAVVRIGPAGPWDDLKKAEELVLKRVKEIKSKSETKVRMQKEVPVPDDIVPKLIGTQGSTIQELVKQVGVNLRIREKEITTDEGQTKEQIVVVGPTRKDGEEGETELNAAVQIVEAKIEELREQGRNSLRDRRDSKNFTEVAVPVELVGGIIGHKGATIEELMRECGVKLKIVDGKKEDGEEHDGSKVVIMSSDADVTARAKDIVLTKIDALRAAKGAGKSAKGDRPTNERTSDRWSGSPRSWWESQPWDERGWKDERTWSNSADRGWADKDQNWKNSWKGWNEDRGWDANDDEDDGASGPSSKHWGRQESAWPENENGPSSFRRSNSKGEADASPAADEEASRASIATKEKEAAELALQGKSELRNGQFESALEIFQKALRLEPRDHVALCGRSSARFSLGRIQEAYQDASRAVRLQPDSPEALLQKGLASKALGQPQDLWEPLFHQTLLVAPDNLEAQQVIAQLRKLDTTSAASATSVATDVADPPAVKPDVRPVCEKRWAEQSEEEEDPVESPNRAFCCGECNEAAEWGAKDESDGKWYCKACWEKFGQAERNAPVSSGNEVPETEVPVPEPEIPNRQSEFQNGQTDQQDLCSKDGDGSAADASGNDGSGGTAPQAPARRLWADVTDADDALDGVAFSGIPGKMPSIPGGRRRPGPGGDTGAAWKGSRGSVDNDGFGAGSRRTSSGKGDRERYSVDRGKDDKGGKRKGGRGGDGGGRGDRASKGGRSSFADRDDDRERGWDRGGKGGRSSFQDRDDDRERGWDRGDKGSKGGKGKGGKGKFHADRDEWKGDRPDRGLDFGGDRERNSTASAAAASSPAVASTTTMPRNPFGAAKSTSS